MVSLWLSGNAHRSASEICPICVSYWHFSFWGVSQQKKTLAEKIDGLPLLFIMGLPHQSHSLQAHWWRSQQSGHLNFHPLPTQYLWPNLLAGRSEYSDRASVLPHGTYPPELIFQPAVVNKKQCVLNLPIIQDKANGISYSRDSDSSLKITLKVFSICV